MTAAPPPAQPASDQDAAVQNKPPAADAAPASPAPPLRPRTAAPSVASEPAAPPAGLACAQTSVTPEAVWARALVLAEASPALHSCMDRLRPLELVADGSSPRMVVGHPPRDRLAAEMALATLGKVLAQALGTPVSVSLRAIADAGGPPARSGVRHDAGTRASGQGAVDQGPAPAPPVADAPVIDTSAALANPLVEDAITLLGATVRGVRPRRGL